MKFYQYPRCSTCRKAQRWLAEQGVSVESIDIVEAPPSARELKRIVALSGLAVGKLFNTSGQVYREGGYKQKLPGLTDAQAIAELASNGKLIKRPLLVGDDFALVGFKVDDYTGKVG